MSAVNKPTPQNIISITYQLLQEINVPGSIRGQMPVITIQFQEDSIVRQKVVAFVEMLPYLRMLKEKATSLGKLLLCLPETTYDKKIVIGYGDPADGFAIVVGLDAVDPCAAIPSVVYLDHAAPLVVGDILYLDAANTLPVIGFNLFVDTSTGIIYGLDAVTGEVLAATGDTCVTPPPAFARQITFQLNGVNFDGSEGIFAQLNGTDNGTDTFNSQQIASIVNFQLPKLTAGQLTFEQEYDVTTLAINIFYTAIDNGATWDVYIINGSNSIAPLNINWVSPSFEILTNNSTYTIQVTQPDATIVNIAPGETKYIQPASTAYRTKDFLKPFADSLTYAAYTIVVKNNGVTIDTLAQMPFNSDGGFPFAAGLYDEYIYTNCVLAAAMSATLFNNGIGLNTVSLFNIPQKLSGADGVAYDYDDLNIPLISIYDFNLGRIIGGVAAGGNERNEINSTNIALALSTDLVPGQSYAVIVNYAVSAVSFTTIVQTILVDNITAQAGADQILTVQNQMGSLAGETNRITNVQWNGVSVAGIAFPVLPSETKAGSIPNGVETVDVTIDTLGLIAPLTVRVVDGAGVNHDQAYVADGVYTFPAISSVGTGVTVILIPQTFAGAKNVFVINNTGAAIQVTTNVATYNFAIGVNGNIVCTDGGTVTNDLGSHSYLFLQSLPATNAPFEVPNPDVLGVAGVHNLNGSIATMNYIRIS